MAAGPEHCDRTELPRIVWEDSVDVSRRKFLTVVAAATTVAVTPRAAAARPDAAEAGAGELGIWRDQVIMTIELAKYASSEADGDLDGTNATPSNDVMRFQFALDDPANQPPKYQGSGLFGGDLVGLRRHAAHIKRVGITTALIYPVMRSDRQDFFGFLPTGYGIRDFQALDANFQSAGAGPSDLADYGSVVRALHDPAVGGYRCNVLQDVAMALVGHEHPWFTPEAAEANINRFRLWDPDTISNNNGSDGSGSTTFIDWVNVDIAATFDIDAFSFAGGPDDGDFDGNGGTYAAEDVGASVFADIGFDNSIGFLFGPKLNGSNNASSGSSERDIVWPVPQFRYGTLALLLAASGDDVPITVRVTYADGTSTDTAVTARSWTPPSAPPVWSATLRRRDPSGVAGTARLYVTPLEIDPTRIATSVRLLRGAAAATVRVFGLSGLPVVSPVRVDLSALFNEDGVASLAAPGDGNLTGSDLLLPRDGLFRRLTSTVVGTWSQTNPPGPTTARFALGPFQPGRDNMVSTRGQRVSITPHRYHYFRLAAFTTAPSAQDVTVTITYQDGTSSSTTITVKPWTAAAASGDVVVHESEFALRNGPNGWAPDFTTRLRIWGYQVPANWTKQVAAITLPDAPNVHVAAINPGILLDSGFGAAILDERDGLGTADGMYGYFAETLNLWLSQGIDGVRFDSVQKYDPSVFRKLLNTAWPNGKWAFAEAAVAEPSATAPDQQPLPWQLRREDYANPSGGIGFTAVYDFETADVIRATFGQQQPALSAGRFALINQSLSWDSRYTQPWNQVTFFDVYENFPFLDIALGDDYAAKLPRLRLAAAYLFSINRVPMIFSGNEYLVAYGQGAANGSPARRPGYLFSSFVQDDPTYQDNFRYMTTLVSMRRDNPALRAAERMTAQSWLLQGDTTFGFVRRATGQQTIIALFNNSSDPAAAFDVRIPSGTLGGGTTNLVLKTPSGSYGGTDPDLSWTAPRTLHVTRMAPFEAKIIVTPAAR